MEKAYNHVNWKIIEIIGRKMGFGWRWVKWMKNCYEDTRFSLIVNGAATNFFKGSRGLCQGDPLSQFLFLMVAEVFSALMKKAERNGLISGFKVKSNETPITHLQFADDTIVFLDANLAQFTALKQILIELQQITD
ncbi:uncharacterized protein LOC113291921 [Papaver somniferum]|uniref:uncharacterized protein LOC113291921 n=1 Tax=Papaver somniferum TaxID=3469 RepID=UPI000E6FA58A|nr:uncharacterized protein LOC113291921 [Papaver somniferum]